MEYPEQPASRKNRYGRLSIGTVACMVCLFAACQHANEAEGILAGASPVYDAPGFTILAPPTVQVEKKIPADFVTYRYIDKASGEQVLFVYGGQYPSFPNKAPDTAKRRELRIHGMKAHSIAWKSPKGLLSRETLVQFQVGSRDLPMTDRSAMYLHCAYINKTKEQAALADAMIASLRPGLWPAPASPPAP